MSRDSPSGRGSLHSISHRARRKGRKKGRMRTIETNMRTVLGRPGFIGAGTAVRDVESCAVAEAVGEAGFALETAGFAVGAGGVVVVCVAVGPVTCCCD
jgi:hypothetical protein